MVLDASIVNAWLLQKKVMETTMPLLDFRRSVAQHLLKQHGTGSRFGEGRLSHRRPQEPSDMIVRATGQFPYQRDFHDADNVEDGVRSSASNAMHLCM